MAQFEIYREFTEDPIPEMLDREIEFNNIEDATQYAIDNYIDDHDKKWIEVYDDANPEQTTIFVKNKYYDIDTHEEITGTIDENKHYSISELVIIQQLENKGID